MTVTLTRVYDSYDEARQAVAKLRGAGIPEADISLVANRHIQEQYPDVTDPVKGAADGAGIGAAIGGGAGLLAGLGLLAIPGLGPVVAAGWLAATAMGAISGAATGGLIGALAAAGVSESDADVYSEVIRRGGTMVTVRTADGNETVARTALDSYNPVDVITRRKEYEKAGWTKFDPNAPDYVMSEADRDRLNRRYGT